MVESKDMWQCRTPNCGYIYNPEKGDRKGKISKGTPFEDLQAHFELLGENY